MFTRFTSTVKRYLSQTGNNTKNKKKYSNTEKVQKNVVFLLKMLTSAENLEGNFCFFSDVFKLHEVLSICASFQVFGILQSEIKLSPPKEQI